MLLTSCKILNMLIALISSMLLSRFRTLDEYGTYSQIQIVVGLATSVFMLGLPNSLNYFLVRAKTEKEKDSFLSLYYILGTVLAIIAGTSLITSGNFLCSYYHNNRIKDFLYVLGILPWTQVMTTSVSNMLVATTSTVRLVIYSILRSLTLLLIIIFVRFIHKDFYFYMALYIVVESIYSLWVYYEAYRLMKKVYFKPDFKLLKAILTFSIPMGIASAIGTLDIYLDNLMVGYFFDTKTLAIFANAAKELPFNMIANAFTAVLVPYMVKQLQINRKEKAIKIWALATEFNTYILAFCVAACLVFAPQILTVLYSSKYVEGAPVFRVYALVLLLKITYFGMALNALGKSKYILYSSIASLGTNIMLNYIFIKIFGTVGAAAATFISMLIIALVQLKISAKLLNVSFGHIFPWKQTGKIILINAMWAICATIVIRILKLDVDTRSIIIAIIIGMFCLLVYVIAVKEKMLLLYKRLGSTESIDSM